VPKDQVAGDQSVFSANLHDLQFNEFSPVVSGSKKWMKRTPKMILIMFLNADRVDNP
jgi:hypothetical protein